MELSQITPLILTGNEAPNIARTLAELSWAERVVVLDSGSTDETVAIARGFANVLVHERHFDSHAAQWNHGLSLVTTEWVLALDADYVLEAGFRDEVRALEPAERVNAFFAGFVYCVHGYPLRASVYPPRAVLFRKACSHFVQDGHTQRLVFEGNAGNLRGRIRHDDRKPLSHWLASQDRYARLEAQHLFVLPVAQLSGPDRLRRQTCLAPLVIFFYLLFVRGLILDGWQGWYYVGQRVLAEILLCLRLMTQRERLENETPA